MERLKRFVWIAAGFAAVALLLTLGTETRAIAQAVRAALVRNQDEPGRNPYSQTVGCFSSGCSVTFPPVPAGQRLVVTFFNGALFAEEGLGLFLGGHGQDFRILPTTLSSFADVANSPVVVYYEAGETPTVGCDGCNDRGISATLSGYYITLP
jgi:hypothetical protein